MTNHSPTFTSSSASASFSENSGTTGSTALHTYTGTMGFKDTDKTDTHTVSASLGSVSWSGGSSIPAASLADLNAALSASILSDSNGTGSLKWTFSAADDDFDFLAKNETLVLTYNVKVSDNHGGFATQTVKITVTGTDDKPIIDTGTYATVTEQANQTLSLSPDTQHIALHFTDADLNNTGQTATVTGVTATGATAGLLPDGLGTAELLAFYHVDNVVKSAGSSSGTINTTFSAPDLAFDYLAAGQTLTLTYTVQIDDHAGGISTQTVVITVIGTNDKPVFLSPPESAHLVEDQNLSSGNLVAHGDLLFTDIDLADTHTVTTSVTATRSGGGSVPLSNADLLAAMHTTLDDSTNVLLGDVAWNFALSNSSVNFLSGGETLTLTYTITVKDPSHAATSDTVTITILGTNHPVAITSGPESASLSELSDTTGSATVDSTSPVPTGTLTFTDQDLSDTHTVAVTVASDTSSAGSLPASTQTAVATALATTLHDSTGSGTGGVDWTFSIPDNQLDFLGANDTLTVVYNVKVSDASTSATQTVTITVNGANDAPVISSGPESGSLNELPNTTGSSALDSTSPVPTGTLAFTDADLSDTHTVGVSLASLVWSADTSFTFFSPTLINDLVAGLNTTLHDSTGSGSGSVDWSLSLPDQDIDFLSAGETLTATFNIAVDDGIANSVQTVTVTMNGASDPLTVNPVVTPVFDTAGTDAGNVVAVGNVMLDVGDTGGDASTTLTVTDLNGSAANLGNFIAGTYGDLLMFSDGLYIYEANHNLDTLQVGDSATDQFTFTVTSSAGAHQTTTLTFNVTGADDAPVITAADTSGSMTEDAGPTVLVNGGFETGDLTGWSGSSSVHVEFFGLGGEFGNYVARLTPSSGTLSQNVATTPGEHYTLSFYISGDPDSSTNTLTATWDGATVLGVSNGYSGALVRYSFDVVGDATHSTTPLSFSYSDDGTGLSVDQVTVSPASGPPTESANGTIAFSDVETGDTHTTSVTPLDSGYVGTFSLDPVSESSGSGSVDWHFVVNNSDIQFLSEGQTLTQDYLVTITDNNGASTTQDVTIAIHGANDPPTAVDDNIVTDGGPNGVIPIPDWALALNDTDPDTSDTLTPIFIVLSSGSSSTFLLGNDAVYFDDATPGGFFTYEVTDGHTTSTNAATATIVSGSATATSLNGGSTDDILIALNGTESMSGGGGNDVLIPNSGSHTMTGGSGNDIFAFESIPNGTDTITDFNNTSEHDSIAVSAAGFGGSLTPGMDTSSVFETSADDQFTGGLFHYDTANNTLYYSPDGTTASASAVVQLQSGVTLQPHDLIIVA